MHPRFFLNEYSTSLVEGGKEAPKPPYVFGKFARAFRDIVMPSIGNPPWISL